MRPLRRIPASVIAAAALLAVLAGAGSAGETGRVLSVRSGTREDTRALPPTGTVVVGVSAAGVEAAWVQPGPTEARPVIVRFDAPTALEAQASGPSARSVDAPFESFQLDLARLESAPVRAGTRAAGTPNSILRLRTTFNGAALALTPKVIDQVRALPYVRAVLPDDSVHACLFGSVPQIHADQLRHLRGVAGEGIVVGIVDTGIDYRHPALGGGFGPAYRVEGGYDVVNGDGDPMDDNGHGTHVAGIVGASGSPEGVAPAVHFLAYKVLNAGGYGLQSWVIAGIDLAVDPDDNPATHDGADVINLSLGGAGTADDPVSVAADAAVAAGVVVVAAAGNDGAYSSIISPGAARNVITVGAADRDGQVAEFSSRGPAYPDAALKPDVIAPGVGIYSTLPGGGYGALSGTSMASPHVAGTAALLRQIHPGWTPELLKAAIMNGAAAAAGGPLERGAGFLDALAASETSFLGVPGGVGFGSVPAGAVNWTGLRGVRVVNLQGSARQFDYTFEGSLPAGVTVAISPASVVVYPGSTVVSRVTVTVPAGTPAPADEPFAWWGDIVVSDGTESHRIPLTVLDGAQIVVNASYNTLFMLLGESSKPTFHVAGSTPFRRFVRRGRYDVLAILPGPFRVVRTGLDVRDSTYVTAFADDATYTMRRICVSETGARVTPEAGFETLIQTARGAGFLSLTLGEEVEYFSDVDPSVAWEWTQYVSLDHRRTYSFLGGGRGLHASRTWQNAPSDLHRVDADFRLDADVTQAYGHHMVTNGPLGLPVSGMIIGAGYYTSFPVPLSPPFAMRTYAMAPPDDAFGFGGFWKSLYPFWGTPVLPLTPSLQTPYLRLAADGSLRGYAQGEMTRTVYEDAGGALHGGGGPPVWFGRFANSADTLRLRASFGNGPWLFLTPGGDWRDHWNMVYALSHDDAPWRIGLLSGMGSYYGDSLSSWVAEPGRYGFTLSFDSTEVDGRRVRSSVAATFDTRAADRDPPWLTALGVTADGAVADRVGAATRNEFRVRAEDDFGAPACTLSWRVTNDAWTPLPASATDGARRVSGGGWTPLPTTVQDGEWRALVPDTVGYLSLRVTVGDAAGNRLEYDVEPAVHVISAFAIERARARPAIDGRDVVLEWGIPPGLFPQATVERRPDVGGAWTALGAPADDGAGHRTFRDPQPAAATTFRYRLAVVRGGVPEYSAEVPVATPAAQLELGVRFANPAHGAPRLTLTIPGPEPYRLEVLDLAGRTRYSRSAPGRGGGEYTLDLSGAADWRPGVYWLRLSSGARVVTRRVALVP